MPRRGENQNILFGFSVVIVFGRRRAASVSQGGVFHVGYGFVLSLGGVVNTGPGKRTLFLIDLSVIKEFLVRFNRGMDRLCVVPLKLLDRKSVV